jgi:hypothetical protein
MGRWIFRWVRGGDKDGEVVGEFVVAVEAACGGDEFGGDVVARFEDQLAVMQVRALHEAESGAEAADWFHCAGGTHANGG